MSSGRCTTVPPSFSWVLPGQGLVTALAIYAVVYVFKAGSKPFILAVAAAGLQLLLGLYTCFTANRAGVHHRVVVPALLVGIAGVWCGPVYYFAKIVDVYLKIQRTASRGYHAPQAATWSYVGLAASCLDVMFALALVVIFLVHGLRARRLPPYNPYGGYAGAPVYGSPASHPGVYYQQPQLQPQQHYYSYQQQATLPAMTSAMPTSYNNRTAEGAKYTTATTTTTPMVPP